MKLKPGEIINERYRIEREIGTGEMSMAYTCVDAQSGNKYIIKHPMYDGKYDDTEVEWLKKEAEILETLSHPHIVGYVDSFEENNVFYLVIEYIDGTSVETLFRNRPATEAQARNYCGQLLTALEYLHNKNIIHRTIGPHIVMISGDSIKLISFRGSERRFAEVRIEPAIIMTSPRYRAPEQMVGEHYFQSDIFAVGVTLYFLLTGRYPSKDPPLSPCSETPQVNNNLDRIVQKATEKDPNKRFQTATEMKEAILGSCKLRVFEHDIAISFAGENREIAENLARKLQIKGIRVFYDEFYKHELWGKKLTKYFQDIYGPKTKFVVVLISKYYPVKDWSDFEFSIMRKEAEKRRTEFILPVRLDDTKILGILEDVGYLDYQREGIDGIVDCLLKKLYSSSISG